MSLKDYFCSSPWLHMRINIRGEYESCRWWAKDRDIVRSNPTIDNVTPAEFFQINMSDLRKQLLNGEKTKHCQECHVMDDFHKVSGRVRQLLKTGVTLEDFEKSLASSKWVDEFAYSYTHDGRTNLLPVDWHIDLGNFCNGACLYCQPKYSTKLASEWKKLGLINELPENSWCDSDEKVDKFIETLIQTTNLKYLHFMGGETLITPAFTKILQALIDSKLTNLTIGFTSNLTVWDETVINQLKQFNEVHVGLSIECFHPVNDYVRWPAKIDVVTNTLNRWVNESKKYNWLIQLRTTPTILTIKYLNSVYEYAFNNNICVESVNFLNEPKYMRPNVLPGKYRKEVIQILQDWVSLHKSNTTNLIVNTRDPRNAKDQTVQDAESYINYLREQDDESFRLPELVQYLKLIETRRKNSIIEYLPEYEELFRSAGY